MVLNEEDETFIVHMAAISVKTVSNVHLSQQAQITSLEVKEIIFFFEDINYTNVFQPNSTIELPNYTNINDHLINRIDNKQLPYGLIYSLRPVKLERLKTDIETNLANTFIRPSKLPVGTLILFIHNKNGNF